MQNIVLVFWYVVGTAKINSMLKIHDNIPHIKGVIATRVKHKCTGKFLSFHHGWWWPLALQSPLTHMSACAYIWYGHSRCNRPVSQIPQCICAISHKARFCNRNVNMCTTVSVYVHCGIFSDAFWDLWNVSIVVATVNKAWVCRKNNN